LWLDRLSRITGISRARGAAAVRTAADPDGDLRQLVDTTGAEAAPRAGWNRAARERAAAT
jgi:hypothetical protein